MRRWDAALGTVVVCAALLAGACSTPSTGPPSAAALIPGLDAVADGASPPADPPADLLVEKEPTKQSDRLLAKTQQKATFCDVVPLLANLEEPEPYDLEKLAEYAAIYVQHARTFKPDSDVRNPDDREEKIDVPEDMVELVQTVRKEMYAYSVRVAYIKALADRGMIDAAEVRRRLERAFLTLYRSPYTAAEREMISLRPRYC